MQRPARYLLCSYWLLLYVSLYLTTRPADQTVVTVLWMVLQGVAFQRIRVHRVSTGQVYRLLGLSQLPGIAVSSLSLANALSGNPNELTDGLLEVWIHPFFPLLEMLPTGALDGLSIAFLVSCMLPWSLVLLPLAVFRVWWSRRLPSG